MAESGDAGRGAATLDELVREERKHAASQAEALRAGDLAALREQAAEHHRHQVEAAELLRDDERILDATLSRLGLEDLLQELLRRTRAVMGVDAGAFLFSEPGGETLRIEAIQGVEADTRTLVAEPLPIAGFLERVVKGCEPLALGREDLQAMGHPALEAEGIQSLLGVPLILEGACVGIYAVGARQERRFTPREVRLMQMVADRAAVAIDRARLLERERQERCRAEAASAHKTALLRMASHDLRTPLTAMRLQLRLLQSRRGDPDRFATSVGVLGRNVERLGLMLDDFLDLARLEGDRFVLHSAPLDLRKVLDEVLDTYAEQARSRGIAITRDTPAAVPVVGDERRLIQVFGNLLSNGLRYTDSGGHIHVAARRDGAHATATVQDDGLGMTAAQRARLFRPFSQVQGRAREAEGSGLGLYLAQAIVREHGGTLTADSPGPGRGSTFTVRLPAAPATNS